MPFCALALLVASSQVNTKPALLLRPAPRHAVAGAVTAIAEPVGRQGSPVQVKLLNGQVALSLPFEGIWRVTCLGDSIWCPTLEVNAGDVVILPIYRAAQLRASVEVGVNRAAPGEFTIQARTREATPVDSTFSAAVTRGEISVAIPDVPLDLRLTAAEFVPIYKFGVEARAGRAELGQLALVPGGSIAGRVVEEASGAPVKARVRLLPPEMLAGFGARNTTEPASDANVQSIEQMADSNGFFQFRGVPAGRYDLEAEHPTHPARRMTLDVEEDSETYLDAVGLRPYIDLNVNLTPPLDPDGKLWQVSVTREDKPAPRSVSATASHSGLAAFTQIEPGRLRVEVSRESGDRVLAVMEDVATDTALDLQVPLVRVIGRVRRGDRGVSRAVVTVHTGQMDHARFEANDRGEFKGMLRRPRAELRVLMADVTTTNPDQGHTVTLSDLDLNGDPLELDIDLGNRGIEGIVVDSRGTPVADARIELFELGIGRRTSTTSSGSDGKFAFSGIRTGRYSLSARHETTGTSGRVSLDLDTTPSSRLTLRLHPWKSVRGRLRSAAGVPVANARVRLVADTGERQEISVDHAGSFAGKLSLAARQVIAQVFAPSHVLWSGCRRVSESEEELEFTLPAAGGVLVVPAVRPDSDDYLSVVTADGGFFGRNDLARWTRMIGGVEPSSEGKRVPRLAPGQYAFVSTKAPHEALFSAFCGGAFRSAADWVSLQSGGEVHLPAPTVPR